MLLAFALAHAADSPADPPVAVRPSVWARPGYTWIADEPTDPASQDGFVIEARASLDAAARDLPVDARVELALLPEPTATDAWVGVTAQPWLRFRFGQMKIPFSTQNLAPDTRRQLPNNVAFLTAVGVTREIGAEAALSVPFRGKTRAVLSSGIYNGEGPNRIQNVNQRYQLVERVLITPAGTRPPGEGRTRDPYLGVGCGWVYDYAGDGLAAEESNTLGCDLQASWEVLSLQIETVDLEVVHANPSVADYHATGSYGQLGVFIPQPWFQDHLELVGRVELYDPTTAFGDGPGESTADLQARVLYTVGANWYVRKDLERLHDLKVQAAYVHGLVLEGDPVVLDRLTVSGLARF